jgi:hypothetical protein
MEFSLEAWQALGEFLEAKRRDGGGTDGGGFREPSAVPRGDQFLYNWRNPRRKDAQEARELAFYRALGLRSGEEAALKYMVRPWLRGSRIS